MTRYFIITGKTKSGWITGGNDFHLALSCKGFPSLQEINKEVDKKGVVISNIIELSESDYYSFLEDV